MTMVSSYSLQSYGKMIADRGRFEAYRRAIQWRVRPGAVVLEIGTGTGVMAMIACECGASRVYAVEPADVVHVAKEVAAENELLSKITFINALSTDTGLPEEVDGIISDLRGVLPLFGSGLTSVLDARHRFLRNDGWLVASRDTLWASVVSSPERYDDLFEGWDVGHSFDLSAHKTRALRWWGRAHIAPSELVTLPFNWSTIDYATFMSPNVSGAASWRIEQSVVAHGLAVWFDTETAPGVRLSNSPLSGETHVYRQGFFPWPKPTPLMPGDEVTVQIRARLVEDDYVWTWNTRVTDSSGRETACFKQSNFLPVPPSPSKLAKRSDSYVPSTGTTGTIDARVLHLMDGRRSLADIAGLLMEEFSGQFRDRESALKRVADLSERYST